MTRRPNEPPRPLCDPRTMDPLTDREIQVLALVAAGERTHAIGRRLGIAENTVKAHLTNVYRKTCARNRVRAARYYLEHYAGQPGEPPSQPMAAATSQLRAGVEASPLIQRQIEELEARLEQLAPAASEVERLQHALNALRAIEPNLLCVASVTACTQHMSSSPPTEPASAAAARTRRAARSVNDEEVLAAVIELSHGNTLDTDRADRRSRLGEPVAARAGDRRLPRLRRAPIRVARRSHPGRSRHYTLRGVKSGRSRRARLACPSIRSAGAQWRGRPRWRGPERDVSAITPACSQGGVRNAHNTQSRRRHKGSRTRLAWPLLAAPARRTRRSRRHPRPHRAGCRCPSSIGRSLAM